MKSHINSFFIVLTAIVCLVLVDSCKKASTISACITTLPASASAGAKVTFTSCTSGSDIYLWSFGDGDSASGATVTHAYALAGSYSGSLRVSSGSTQSTKAFTINIISNNFTYNGTVYNTDSVIASVSGGTVSAVVSTGTNSTTTLTCKFATLPTASGNYPIISSDSFPTGNQVYVIVNNYSPTAGQSTFGSASASPALNAAITVSSGKLSITLPALELYKTSQRSDSASVSGTITQTQ